MILIVDDDYSVTASLGLLLKQKGFASVTATTPESALAEVVRGDVDLVLQDMNFSRETSGAEGLELLRRIRAARPGLPVILITAWGSIQLAVEGMKAGAADFITKPWSNEQVHQAVRTTLGLAATRSPDAPTDRSALDAAFDLEGVIGRHPRFVETLELLTRVASTDASILISGDTGTGKEVLAAAVHRNGPRRRKPFIRVNLAALPVGLFDSELFGHVRGAFTDAQADRPGRLAAAQGGTILLDEIGDLDLTCQVKLLRVLQDRSYEVLGANRPQPFDVRVIAATNIDLEQAIRDGAFREDLYYRINLIRVRVPSLAERASDVPLLAVHFLQRATASHERRDAAFEPGALEWLEDQPWPGNIRQLQHLIERALLTGASSRIGVDDLRRTLAMDFGPGRDTLLPSVGSMTLPEIERAMILKALKHHEGNVSRTADSLGMSRPALYRRLEKYGIEA
ncbi:MAG: sigma-54-dependent Fis family transcriptional regulator [Candidatus Eisenbacteria bacterium]|uniref:Sigma-54-dependent Fis family transcriptional regulator n=1 Tax=Eiseniibacteriota bacterium TaxID=2212470 RepID=A0A849SKM0_UNCEI|nr:sigma-54-dependent Fis family transcriptional regulator [Candidatus Eisenbacteria bacterium]